MSSSQSLIYRILRSCTTPSKTGRLCMSPNAPFPISVNFAKGINTLLAEPLSSQQFVLTGVKGIVYDANSFPEGTLETHAVRPWKRLSAHQATQLHSEMPAADQERFAEKFPNYAREGVSTTDLCKIKQRSKVLYLEVKGPEHETLAKRELVGIVREHKACFKHPEHADDSIANAIWTILQDL